MPFIDFEFDGLTLQQRGFVICNFNGSSDLNTIENGSDIIFNTVPVKRGTINYITSTNYDNTLETTFQICKNPCNFSNMKLSVQDVRTIQAWLCRTKYKKLRFINTNGDRDDLYYEAMFKISRIEIDDDIYGLELTVQTNRPYAIGADITKTYEGSGQNWTFTVNNQSDYEGTIHPKMKIKTLTSGDLTIVNSVDGSKVVVKDCKANETITLDYPFVSSSIISRKIYNDFNWVFPTLVKIYGEKSNEYTVSISAQIEFTYTPSIMFGI